jgi:hypothetical protein
MIISLNPHADPALIAMMKQGRGEAFNKTYKRYGAKRYTTAVKGLKPKDIIQDLFISFWMKVDFKGKLFHLDLS